MKLISIGLFIEVIFGISSGQGWHEYDFDKNWEAKAWHEANEFCRGLGYGEYNYDWTLPVIGDDDTGDYNALINEKDSVGRNRRIKDGEAFWVGLYRNAGGAFAWADGTPCETSDGLCVNDWLTTPNLNAESEYCVTMTVDEDDGTRGYETAPCSTPLRYMCSFINGTTPAPIHDEDERIEGYCGEDTYAFNGRSCYVWGDPHFTLWNGAQHDYMGNPQIRYSQFYYVAPCFDADATKLPFTIIGNHYFWVTGGVTTLEYITFELFRDSYGTQYQYDKYYLWLSSEFQAYIDATDSSHEIHQDNPDYYYHEANKEDFVPLAANIYQLIGTDGKFQVRYTKSGSTINAWLKVKEDGTWYDAVHLEIRGTHQRGGKYRVHALTINQPHPKYRCFICGLCGDFKRSKKSSYPQELITCKGGLESYNNGWSSNNAFAYDLNGNTWGYEYFHDQCSLHDRDTTRRRFVAAEDEIYTPTVGDNFVYVDPYLQCSAIQQDVTAACVSARAASSSECVIVGTDVCDELEEDCKLDLCVLCGNDESTIDENIESAWDIPLELKVEEAVGSSAYAWLPNDDSFMGANEIDNNYKHPQYDYNDYEPNEYPNNTDVVAIKSTWIFYGGLLLLILLTINCAYMCYINTTQKGKSKYSAVKFADSEYDDSEAPMNQQKS